MSIRTLSIAMLAASIIVAPARADDIDGFMLGKANLFARNNTPLNPGNRFRLPDDSVETALLLEGTVRKLRFRFRAEARGAIATARDDDEWPQDARLRVQQLYLPVLTTKAVVVQAGKQVRSWDQGLSYTPLGFFRSNPDIRDPVDVEGRVEGLPMLVVSHVGDRLAVEVVGSDRLGTGDAAQRDNGRQLAVRFSGQLVAGLDTALVVRQRAHAAPGIGASFAYAKDRIEIHADLYAGQPEAAYRRRALFDAPPQYRTTDPLVFDAPRGFMVNSIVGGSFSASDRLTFRGEWAHHGDGVTKAEWRTYLRNITLHRDGLATGDPRAVPSLAYDLSAMGQGGIRRDYLFVGASYDGTVISPSIYCLAGLADGSTTTTASATWKATPQLDLAVQATILAGSKTSEFGLSPFRAIISLRLLRRFR